MYSFILCKVSLLCKAYKDVFLQQEGSLWTLILTNDVKPRETNSLKQYKAGNKKPQSKEKLYR